MWGNLICIVHLSVNTTTTQTTEWMLGKYIAAEWIHGTPCVLLLSFSHWPETNFLLCTLYSKSFLHTQFLNNLITSYVHHVLRSLPFFLIYQKYTEYLWCIEEYVRETTETAESCPLALKEFAVLTRTTMCWSSPWLDPPPLPSSPHHWVPNTCCRWVHSVYITCTPTYTDSKCLDDTIW